jgi:hypothetical protein
MVNKIISGLESKLKLMTGRVLTQEEMEKAKRGVKVQSQTFGGQKVLEYAMEGNHLVVTKSQYQWMTTADFSYGWSIPHEGLNLTRNEVKVYSAERLLLREDVTKSDPINHDWNSKTYECVTPGSIRMKRVKN